VEYCLLFTCDDDNEDENAAADEGCDQDGGCAIYDSVIRFFFLNKRYCAKRVYVSKENPPTLVFSFLCAFLMSDKYVLVSIEKLNPTEYGTFYVPYLAKECAIFDRHTHT
jgi:hypothetical protein